MGAITSLQITLVLILFHQELLCTFLLKHMSILLAQAEFCSILGTNISSFKNICVLILAPESLCLVSKKSLSPQPYRPSHLSEVPFPADAPRLHSILVSTTWFSVKTANVPLPTALFPTRTTGSSKSLMPAFNEHYCTTARGLGTKCLASLLLLLPQ